MKSKVQSNKESQSKMQRKGETLLNCKSLVANSETLNPSKIALGRPEENSQDGANGMATEGKTQENPKMAAATHPLAGKENPRLPGESLFLL